MRQSKRPSDVRDEAYRLALYHARERANEGDPEGAGVIRDLAASIKRIRLTLDADVAAKARTIGDLDMNVRLARTLGEASPASLVDEVLDNDAHPLRSKLRKRDLKDLAEVRQKSGAI
ncbi:MAG TPA: hypothetical protein VF509_00275 [Sphingobium sp.]